MEAPDPAPANGAGVELHLDHGGRDPTELGVESASLGEEAQTPVPKTSQEASHHAQANHQASAADPAGTLHDEGLNRTTTHENGAFDGTATSGTLTSLKNGPEYVNGTFEHQNLATGEETEGNLQSQDHRLGCADTEDTLTQNHTPQEGGIEDSRTQNHILGETDIEQIMRGTEGSLTLQNQILAESAVEETQTNEHIFEEAGMEETVTHDQEPLKVVSEGFLPGLSNIPEESQMEDTLTSSSIQSVPDGIEETFTTQNEHEDPSSEGSLTLQSEKPDEARFEDTSAHSYQPAQDCIEVTIATDNHIPPEAAIDGDPMPQFHRVEPDGIEESLMSPHKETSEPTMETSSLPPEALEVPGIEDMQSHSYGADASPQKEQTLEENSAPGEYLSPALQQVLEQNGEESSDKDLTDSASTDNTLEDSSEFLSSPLVDNVAPQPILSPPILQDEDITADGWRGRRKHVFVLSEAGKPIYSRYGNEEALSSTMGVMMALVSFVQSGNNIIRSIYSGDHKVVFVQKGPLVLVSVSRTLQSEYQLRRELHYVYYQIISMLTQASIRRIFEHKKNYDLRRLLAGSEKILDSLLNLVETDASFLLGAVQCLPLAASVRDALNGILLKAITPNLVFSILLANSQLVTIVQEKAVIEDCRLDPTDLLILLNLIRASSAFQAGEIWTPICLPRFNPDGYFYAYISYLDPECTVCLILLSTDKDSFYSVSDCKKRIDENLRTQNLLQAITSAQQSHSYSSSLVGVPDLRHFMYKPLDIPENYKQLTQFTSPEAEGPYTDEEEGQRLFDLYRSLHSRIHSSSRPLKLIYHVAEKETLLAWVTSKFELYTSYSPLVTKAGAINVITKLLRWIKKEEDRLFIRYPPKYSTTPVPGKGAKSSRSSSEKIDAAENGFLSGL